MNNRTAPAVLIAVFALTVLFAPLTFAQNEISSVTPPQANETSTSENEVETEAENENENENEAEAEAETTDDEEATEETAEGYTVLTVAQQSRIDDVWSRIDTRLDAYSDTTKASVVERVQDYLTTAIADLKQFAISATFTPEGAARHQLKIEIMEYLLTLVA